MSDDDKTEIEEEFEIPNIPDVEKYSQDVLRTVLSSIKTSNCLPSSGNDYDFYQSFKGFRSVMKAETKNIMQLIKKILSKEGTRGLFEKLDVDEQFDFIIDTNDSILERIGTACDELSGVKKNEEDLVFASISGTTSKMITTSWNRHKSRNKGNEVCLLSAKNIQRPQMKFKEKTDNSNSSFVPSIKEKPNSIKPLSIICEVTSYGEEYSHPYEVEIEKFVPSATNLEVTDPVFPKSYDETNYKYIDKVKDLVLLSEELKKQKEFAVDLEAHSYRSFLGFTCLMQISTRMCDYIVDTLELRSDLYILNESFTDPKIVKIFHGAESDIEWLQRDFGVYVVNLFDTFHASQLLNMSRHSLGFLLTHYCNVNANKQYQLADWRIRPLPKEMERYAREDTHYLLYIYDCMKRDLVNSGNEESNLLHSVFNRSKITCLRRYKKPILSDKSHLELYKKSKKYFNSRQMYALEALYQWRDRISRAEDESTGYVLPNHMLLYVCEVLPKEQQGILACCNPIPPIVRQQLNEMHLVILDARQKPLTKKVFSNETDLQVMPSVRAIDTEGLLHCPHDLSRESRNDESVPPLPTVLFSDEDGSLLSVRNELARNSSLLIKKQPIIDCFKDGKEINKIIEKLKFVSPFQRYSHTNKSTEEMENDEKIDSEELRDKKDSVDDRPTVAVQDSSVDADEKQDAVKCAVIDDENPQPLRKRSKNSNERSKTIPKAKAKRWKKNQSCDSDDHPKTFTPFDYKSQQSTVRRGGPSSRRNFNPDAWSSEPRRGLKSRSKQKKGNKSSYLPESTSRGGQSGSRGGQSGSRGGQSGSRGGRGKRRDERNCSYWQMVFTSIDRAFENHSSVNDSTFYPSYKRIMEMAIDGMNDLNCSNIPTIPDDLKTVNITNYNWHE